MNIRYGSYHWRGLTISWMRVHAVPYLTIVTPFLSITFQKYRGVTFTRGVKKCNVGARLTVEQTRQLLQDSLVR